MGCQAAGCRLAPPSPAVVPGGRLPLGVQRYGPTPPVAVKVMAIGAPVETGVVGPPAMVKGAGRMVMPKPPEAVAPAESVATTEKENWPGVFGVPDTIPVEERARPSGRLPLPREKV